MILILAFLSCSIDVGVKTYTMWWIKSRPELPINWNNKLLSYAGNETLIKAIGQSIPVYSMSCFKFSQGLLDDSNHVLSRFWWGNVGEKRKLHWKK